MNKKTILAYVLIGLVVIGFFKINQKSPETLAQEEAWNAYQEETRKKDLEKLYDMQAQFEAKLNAEGSIFNNVNEGIEEVITLTNGKLDITLSTLGGRITSATLKEYKDQNGNNLVLFDSKDKLNASEINRMNYIFNFADYGSVGTEKYHFKKQKVAENEAVLRLDFTDSLCTEERYIDFEYKLHPNSYMVDLFIKAHNMEELLSNNSNEIGIVWTQLLRQ